VSPIHPQWSIASDCDYVTRDADADMITIVIVNNDMLSTGE
jgi:hypothetical protein